MYNVLNSEERKQNPTRSILDKTIIPFQNIENHIFETCQHGKKHINDHYGNKVSLHGSKEVISFESKQK